MKLASFCARWHASLIIQANRGYSCTDLFVKLNLHRCTCVTSKTCERDCAIYLGIPGIDPLQLLKKKYCSTIHCTNFFHNHVTGMQKYATASPSNSPAQRAIGRMLAARSSHPLDETALLRRSSPNVDQEIAMAEPKPSRPYSHIKGLRPRQRGSRNQFHILIAIRGTLSSSPMKVSNRLFLAHRRG